MKMARILSFGVAVVLLATGAAAKSDSHGDKNNGGNGAVDFSKKDYMECYKANPGCTGECADDGTGNLTCQVPADAQDGYDLCGGDKSGKGNFAPWTEDGATMACTCAEGYVTSAKVRDMYANSDKMPPASKLCTVQCDTTPECLNGNGPFDCFCPDDGEGAQDYVSKKDANDADKQALDEAKTTYQDTVDQAKTDYENAKDAAKEAYDEAKQAAKDIYDQADKGDSAAKQAYEDAKSAAKNAYDTAKSEAKNIYETAKSEAKNIYEQAKSDIKNGVDPAPPVAKATPAAKAAPAKTA